MNYTTNLKTLQLLVITALIALFSPELFAQSPATPLSITMDIETVKKGKVVEDESGTMTMTFGGSKYAMSMDLGKASTTVIFDGEKKTMTSVAETSDGLVATIMPILKVGKQTIEPFTQVEKTGKSAVMLGHETHEYVLSQGGDPVNAWLAELPEVRWADFVATLTSAQSSQAKAMLPSIEGMPNAFPLKSTSTRKGGKVVSTSVVTQLSIGSEADLSPLEIPAEATVQDMSSLLRF